MISVDTKKKELIGNLQERRQRLSPQGRSRAASTCHDFADKTLGKVVPYGVYDIAANAGWVSLGVTSDTSAVRRQRDQNVDRADRAGRAIRACANSPSPPTAAARTGRACSLWKVELQKLADETGLALRVSTTIRREPRSGTGSSIACSVTSPKTGAASRWKAARR